MQQGNLNQNLGIVRESLFFPSKENEKNLIDFLVNYTTSELLICIYSFTNKNIGQAILEIVRNRKIKVKLITDDRQMSQSYSLITTLKQASQNQIEIRHDNNKWAEMHNKYVIIDSKYVITGSFNWSEGAVNKNRENLVILEGSKIAENYKADFINLWQEFILNTVASNLIDSGIKEKANLMNQKVDQNIQQKQYNDDNKEEKNYIIKPVSKAIEKNKKKKQKVNFKSFASKIIEQKDKIVKYGAIASTGLLFACLAQYMGPINFAGNC